MPIPVRGLDWPSKRALEAALANIPNPRDITITYGQMPGDKLWGLYHLRDSGIHVPIFTTDYNEALYWQGWGIETWGRLRRHSQGRDIAVFNTDTRYGGRRWRNRDFWVQRIPNVAQELRVHVFEGRAFRMGVKQPDTLPEPHHEFIRSGRLGWVLSYSAENLQSLLPRDVRKSIRSIAIAACAALNIQLGAVDILRTESGDVYTLEVNTAPSLGEHTLNAYVRVIGEYAATN